jgi:tetratricopeptide (TPR) repeat protein
VQVKILANDKKIISNTQFSTEIVSLVTSDHIRKPLSITVDKIIPETTNFISLFVIGQIKYINNEAKTGRDAFDAATVNIPESVSIQDKSVLSFFSARQLQTDNNKEENDNVSDNIICKYSEAIQADPSLSAAYNNIALIMARSFPKGSGPVDHLSRQESIKKHLSNRRIDCLEKADIHDYLPDSIFDISIEKSSNWQVPIFNKLAYDWRFNPPIDRIKSDLNKIIKKDSTIFGAYLLLGVIAFENEEYKDALYFFRKTLELKEFPEIYINLAQTYIKINEIESAKNNFLNVLKYKKISKEVRNEAFLGLANISIKKSDNKAAINYLLMIKDDGFNDVVNFLKSRIYLIDNDIKNSVKNFNKTSYISWLQRLSIHPSDVEINNGRKEVIIPSVKPIIPLYFENFLRFIYGNMNKMSDENYDFNKIYPKFLIEKYPIENDNYPKNKSRVEGRYSHLLDTQTISNAWDSFATNCGFPENLRDIEPNNQCLSNPKQTISKLYDSLVDQLSDRIFDVESIHVWPQCPFVYSFNKEKQSWQFETTVLYKLVGKESEVEQMRELSSFDGRLKVREVEAETSHIDSIKILVEDSQGRHYELLPDAELVKKSDSKYLVMNQGDEIIFNFPEFSKITQPKKISVAAKGYYIPH